MTLSKREMREYKLAQEHKKLLQYKSSQKLYIKPMGVLGWLFINRGVLNVEKRFKKEWGG